MIDQYIYLRLLILFAPFTSPNLLKNGGKKISKMQLRNQIIAFVNHEHIIPNYDIVDLLINYYYPADQYSASDLLNILKQVSQSILIHNYNRLVVNFFETHDHQDILSPLYGPKKMLVWAEMNRMVSTSILKVIYYVSHHYAVDQTFALVTEPVSTVENQLYRVLERGVAETHVHLTGALPFDFQWSYLLQNFHRADIDELSIRLDNNKSIQVHKDLQRIDFRLSDSLFYAAIIYILLAYHCCENRRVNVDFNHSVKSFEKETGCDVQILIDEFLNADFQHPKMTYIDEIIQKLGCSQFDYIGEIFYQAKKIQGMQSPEKLEYINLFYCTYYWQDHPSDEMFARVFLQYIHLKNIIYRLIVQSGKVKGLDEFRLFFASQRSLIDPGEIMFNKIFNIYAYNNVRYLEIKVGSIQSNNLSFIEKTMKKTIVSFCKSYKSHLEWCYQEEGVILHPPLIAGIVLQFNKRAQLKKDVCWLDAQENNDENRLYFRSLQNEWLANLAVLQHLRSTCRYLENFIVGIDAASNELATDPWVFAPIFRYARKDSDEFTEMIKNKYQLTANPCRELGITYHVGEVHRSLISGYRHIDEVIENFGFLNGERLGHCTVLGLDVDQWFDKTPISIMPRYELLFNWLWIFHLISTNSVILDISVAYIQKIVFDIARDIFEKTEGLTLEKLYQYYINQFDLKEIPINHIQPDHSGNKHTFGCKYAKECVGGWSQEMLHSTQHCYHYLRKMNETVQVENEEFRSICISINKYLMEKISQRGIIVEVNPVSNFLIGEFDDIFHHPVLTMNPIPEKKAENIHVMATINTDDPGVFSTTLQNQFGYIEQALCDRGHSKEDILQWINKIRQYGCDSTFLSTTPKTYESIIKELEDIIAYMESE